MTGNRRLTPPQSRRVNSLAKKSCCNCDKGKCLLLDDGEECVCPQLISYSLLCKWFRTAVLRLDSVLNMSATALFDVLPRTILWLLPTPLTTFWSAGDMAAHGIQMDLEQMNGLIPSTFQVILILGIMAIVSFFLIDRLYKQRGE